MFDFNFVSLLGARDRSLLGDILDFFDSFLWDADAS